MTLSSLFSAPLEYSKSSYDAKISYDHNKIEKTLSHPLDRLEAKVNSLSGSIDPDIATPTTAPSCPENAQISASYRARRIEDLPWGNLEFASNEVVERLGDLHETLNSIDPFPESAPFQRIIHFVGKLLRKEELDHAPLLGEITYAIDRHFSETLENLEDEDLDRSIQWINKRFREDVSQIRQSLKEHQEKHQSVSLQSSAIAYRVKLPIELAKLLLNSNGRINLGIADALLSMFEINTGSPKNYDLNIVHTLKELNHFSCMREKFSSIAKPCSKGAPANQLIRITLGLPKEVELTDLHAKQVALSALFSHLRQDVDGACFATSIVNQLQMSHLHNCLVDIISLLKNSHLMRSVDGICKSFPFLLQLNHNGLEKPIRIGPDGKIIGGEGYLWQAPGIQAACNAIGSSDPISALQMIISNKEETTIKELFQELTKAIGNEKSFPKWLEAALFYRACFAFESEVSNPLLNVWKNTIAAMAEAQENSMIMSAILDSVKCILEIEWKKRFPDLCELGDRVSQQISQALLRLVHLQYDPSIRWMRSGSDTRSTDGAYVVYDKKNSLNSKNWIRVDTPQAFQKFLKRVISSIPALEQKRRQIKALSEYIDSESFLLSLLHHYYSPNKHVRDPLKNLHRIKCCPWITRSGNDLNRVLKIYYGPTAYHQVAQVEPDHAEELWEYLKSFFDQLPEDLKQQIEQNPALLLPIRIQGIHAFSLMIAQIPLISKPDSDISEHEISDSQRKTLLRYVSKHFIPGSHQENFQARKETISRNISIRQFRRELFSIIKLCNDDYRDFRDSVKSKVDEILLKSLPEDLMSQLHQSPMHFADTNWQEGLKDIHLCFITNPGNGKIEIWAVSDDNSKLYPLEQDGWIRHQIWNFYLPGAASEERS